MTDPVIVVLAGGLARRIGGGDKALLKLGDGVILDHLLARLAGQGRCILLNANGDPARFERFGLPIVPDTIAGWPGPLAGILAGMLWVAERFGNAADVVTVPADCPFLPCDLVSRLGVAREAAGADIAAASSGGRMHPVAGLWPVRLAAPLRAALREEGVRRVGQFASRYRVAEANFAVEGGDPFFNVNRPDDHAAAEARVREDQDLTAQPAGSSRLVEGSGGRSIRG